MQAAIFQEAFPQLPVQFWPDWPFHAETVQRSDQKPAGGRGACLRPPVQRSQLGAGARVHLRGTGPPPVAGGGQGILEMVHIIFHMMQARHPSIQGSTMKIILQNLPLPEGDKLNFINSLNGLQTPLLQDRTVFILTFLLGKKFSRSRWDQGWALNWSQSFMKIPDSLLLLYFQKFFCL